MPASSPVALFDFDGTLTRRDTLLPFLRHVVGTGSFTARMTSQAPDLLGLLLGLRANDEVKQKVLKAVLGGQPMTELLQLGKTFAETRIPALLRPSVVSILRWHQTQGHRCLLVSASLDLYLIPWGQAFGVEAVLCSRLEASSDGRATGKLQGRNTYGAEKSQRVCDYLGLASPDILCAYGDSRGDEEMLGLARHAWYRGRFRGSTPPRWMDEHSS